MTSLPKRKREEKKECRKDTPETLLVPKKWGGKGGDGKASRTKRVITKNRKHTKHELEQRLGSSCEGEGNP